MPMSDQELLMRLVDSTARIETKVDALAGHDKRIRRLERWHSAVAGAVGVVSVAVGYVLHQLRGGS